MNRDDHLGQLASEPDMTSAGQSAQLAMPILPDHPPLFRHLDPAAALAFRTPLQEHSPAADTKAAAILTALGIMFTLLAKLGAQLSPILWGDPDVSPTLLSHAASLIGWAGFVGFVAFSLGALVQAFRTFSPRLPRVQPSLAFFGDIAALTREEYVEKVSSLSHDEALKNMLAYNHNLSKICVEKFLHLRWAVKLFQGAFYCWLAQIILIAYREFR